MQRIIYALILCAIISGCSVENTETNNQSISNNQVIENPKPVISYPSVDRETLIPSDQAKISPKTDLYPPITVSNEYSQAEPMPYPVNTRGAEDSAYMMPDGRTLYVWFTPNNRMNIYEQLDDNVTGIYVFNKTPTGWSDAKRVWLQDPGKVALDGCGFVLGNKIWVCSAREGYTGMHWITAEYNNGKWQNWVSAGFDPKWEVGELHITGDGKELYFHSPRDNPDGNYDIWLSKNVDGKWRAPQKVNVVNSDYADGWPYVTEDGRGFWFTRIIGIPELWRSKKVNGMWQEPEQMFKMFAGEASLDPDGNVYFTHHFYKDNKMLEADIYVAHKK